MKLIKKQFIPIYISQGDMHFWEKYPDIIRRSKKNLDPQGIFDVLEYYIDIPLENLLNSQQIDKIVEYAIEIANKFSQEPINLKKDSKSKVSSYIKSSIQAYFYKEETKRSVFDLLSNIFFKISRFHPLANGNKRMAFSCLIIWMQICGLFFDGEIDYTQVEPKLLEFSAGQDNDEKLKNNIKNFLIDNVIIFNRKLEEE